MLFKMCGLNDQKLESGENCAKLYKSNDLSRSLGFSHIFSCLIWESEDVDDVVRSYFEIFVQKLVFIFPCALILLICIKFFL